MVNLKKNFFEPKVTFGQIFEKIVFKLTGQDGYHSAPFGLRGITYTSKMITVQPSGQKKKMTPICLERVFWKKLFFIDNTVSSCSIWWTTDFLRNSFLIHENALQSPNIRFLLSVLPGHVISGHLCQKPKVRFLLQK